METASNCKQIVKECTTMYMYGTTLDLAFTNSPTANVWN